MAECISNDSVSRVKPQVHLRNVKRNAERLWTMEHIESPHSAQQPQQQLLFSPVLYCLVGEISMNRQDIAMFLPFKPLKFLASNHPN